MNTATHRAGPLRRLSQTLAMWALLLLLAGVVGPLWGYPPDAEAATGAKVAPATLDTAHGPYVVGQTPGRVEVLFFSFPG